MNFFKRFFGSGSRPTPPSDPLPDEPVHRAECSPKPQAQPVRQPMKMPSGYMYLYEQARGGSMNIIAGAVKDNRDLLFFYRGPELPLQGT